MKLGETFAVLMAVSLIFLYFRILFSLTASFKGKVVSGLSLGPSREKPWTAEWRLGKDQWKCPAADAPCLYSSVCFYRDVCEGRAWLVRVPVGRASRAHELDLIHAGAYGVFTHGAECLSCVVL